MSSVTLRSRTRDLLINRPRRLTLSDVAEGTGLTQPFLEDLLYKDIKNPSVDRIQILYEFLSGKKLDL
jgi:transcriptional regulator with XRE-family HTH domain